MKQIVKRCVLLYALFSTNLLLSQKQPLDFLTSYCCIFSPSLVNPPQSLVTELNRLAGFERKNFLPPTTSIPLFERYPKLKNTIPFISLGDFSTPIERAYNFGNEIGCNNLYIKRDDCSGRIQENGVRNYGGNKVRKLEFELGSAIACGAQAVMTFGVVGSCHLLATAWYAQQLGLVCIGMVKPQHNSQSVRDKLLMHQVMGTTLYHYPDNAWRNSATIIHWWDYQQCTGNFPYLIPTGASCPFGVVGFVNAAYELKNQIDAHEMPEPDYLYVAGGSLGTAAGLILGLCALGIKTKVIVVTVEPTDEQQFNNELLKLIEQTNRFLHEADNSFLMYACNKFDFEIRTECAGLDYGLYTEQGKCACTQLQSCEHITLDGTYTAKAMAALVMDVQQNRVDKGSTILFWNTYCGTDYGVMTAQADYKKLPNCLHHYFETEVQELDR
jgi:1-aminocyclopropane-1-carboxylate deaminase/D-cysteine desulfhydrase-like pyridoxal-dependent ACC family enzyme